MDRRRLGFTLIEIVIVLAIAALILIIVFLAVAGAQRSQRDRVSMDAAAKVIAGYSSYLSGNNNKPPDTPTDMNSFTTNYLMSVKDGRGVIPTATSAGNAATLATFRFRVRGRCSTDGSGKVLSGGGDNEIAVAYYSETARTSVCKQG